MRKTCVSPNAGDESFSRKYYLPYPIVSTSIVATPIVFLRIVSTPIVSTSIVATPIVVASIVSTHKVSFSIVSTPKMIASIVSTLIVCL